jgi:hypothetical protein
MAGIDGTAERHSMTTQPPTIAEQAQSLAAGSAATMPVTVRNAFAAEQAALDARGVPTGVATPGQ